ncbi:hypothetical protein N9850_10660 [Granulosicoccus sp.]|nr:hypothetical protein [Granulosicoccus sp.]MDB4224223.1 hypothetical protein [Granulosicoccus sp.]
MINSTNTVNIDGTGIPEVDLKAFFTGNSDDTFTRWVVRPLAVLAAVAFGFAIFLAGAFLTMLTLAFMPILAVSVWAMRTKFKRDSADSPVIIEASEDVDSQPTV